jgi:hypothetical protein
MHPCLWPFAATQRSFLQRLSFSELISHKPLWLVHFFLILCSWSISFLIFLSFQEVCFSFSLPLRRKDRFEDSHLQCTNNAATSGGRSSYLQPNATDVGGNLNSSHVDIWYKTPSQQIHYPRGLFHLSTQFSYQLCCYPCTTFSGERVKRKCKVSSWVNHCTETFWKHLCGSYFNPTDGWLLPFSLPTVALLYDYLLLRFETAYGRQLKTKILNIRIWLRVCSH